MMRELTMDELKDVSGGDGAGASTGISIALTGISGPRGPERSNNNCPIAGHRRLRWRRRHLRYALRLN